MKKNYKGYLIDLDGTVYNGNQVINEAALFVRELKEKNIPYLFVTNNSTRTPGQVADKLEGMGIPATADHVLTTSMATASYIQEETPGAHVYHIGEEGLEKALVNQGLTLDNTSPDYVIVGLDRSVTYDKLGIACLAVRNGATFISTNPDRALPTEKGLYPGNGAITSVVTVSTGQEPIFIGKPEPIIVEQALKKLGTSRDETLMVGDNYHTDILAGIRAALDTLMVTTGVTTKEMVKDVDHQPTQVIDTLKQWPI